MKWQIHKLLLIILLLSFHGAAQNTYFIKDAQNQESIPFVKVRPDIGDPFIADLDGRIEVDQNVSEIRIQYIGFVDTNVVLGNVKDSTIFLWRNVQVLQEVTATAGENPAHRIIQKAIDNRKANHPLKNDAFTYNSYSKFVFDANTNALNVSSENDNDSSAANVLNYFQQQHFFVVESASKRTFIPPNKDKEEIIAFKLSGLSDPTLSTFAQSMQSFCFYDNEFSLLGKKYINPIASGGISRYLFILQDTTLHGKDTTFTIYFRPRKGKNFDGLEGHLYINTNRFAVEKVSASTYNSQDANAIKIIQEYEFIDGFKWFPVRLSTNLGFLRTNPDADTAEYMILGDGHTYIEDIHLNPSDLPKKLYNNIDLLTRENALELDEKTWDTIRKYNLTEKEARTHHKADSISEQYKFQQRYDFLKTLAEGKIRMGYVDLLLDRIINYNEHEGVRFGAGLETSRRLSKHFNLGGYFGWATKDKLWKYGGHANVFISRKRDMKIELKYQQDLLERGGHNFTDKTFFGPEQYRWFFINRMENQRLAEVSFHTDIKANMHVRLFGNYQRVWYNYNYGYLPNDTAIYVNNTDVDLAETGIEFKWSILEKFMLLGDTKVSEGKKYPTIKVKVTKGWKGWWESNYDYWRINAEISEHINYRGLFHVYITATADKTFGSVPLFLNQTPGSTRIDWMLDVPNTFQTILAGSVYCTEQVALFTRFKFRAFHTKAKWNEPGFTLHHALGYGNFKGREEHNTAFQSMDKGVFEAGLILDGILTNNFYGIGLGGFYKYGYYADPIWYKNIVPKITLSINLQ